MKNVLVIESGLKSGWTTRAADNFIELVEMNGQIRCEKITLRDEEVALCTGCAVCLEFGEKKCKNEDDSAHQIFEKMKIADGIVIITPNYSLQVPSLLKNLFDRLAYVFHRPALFKKPSLAIVVQGVYGGDKILKYIDDLMGFWGCTPVKGAVLNGGLYPSSKLSDYAARKNATAMNAVAGRFFSSVLSFKERSPSFFRLAIFRMTRTSMRYSDEALKSDKAYYDEHGWFESLYYTDVKIGLLKRMFGSMIDRFIKNMFLRENAKKELS